MRPSRHTPNIHGVISGTWVLLKYEKFKNLILLSNSTTKSVHVHVFFSHTARIFEANVDYFFGCVCMRPLSYDGREVAPIFSRHLVEQMPQVRFYVVVHLDYVLCRGTVPKIGQFCCTLYTNADRSVSTKIIFIINN